MLPSSGKIVIAGGRGLVGTALQRSLLAQGHRVVILSRHPPLAPPVEGITLLSWEDLDQALEDATAVINLCGEGIGQGRWTPERKRVLLESRTGPTRLLVQALSRLPAPGALVNASAIGFYGYQPGDFQTEDSPTGEGFLAGVCRAWEAEAQASSHGGLRVVRLRLGVVLARGGGALPRLATSLRWGLGSPLGSGRQGVSWIHMEDLVRLLGEAALDPSYEGVYNAVAPEPVSQAAFVKALGRRLHRPILPVPAWLSSTLLRLTLGELAEELILGGTFALPERLQDRNFRFRYPDLEGALASLFP